MSVETQTLPVLPLRDVVVYPHMVIPLFVGREKSIKALDKAAKGAIANQPQLKRDVVLETRWLLHVQPDP